MLDKINQESRQVLFSKVKNMLNDDYRKHTTGFSAAEGFLIFDIGNEQSIHISPSLEIIKLVDNLTWADEDYDEPYQVAILNKFFSTVEDKIETFIHSLKADFSGRFILFTGLVSLPINTQEIYFESEIWWFKSLFSGHIAAFCFSPSGEYAFRLPDNNVLHVYISRVYLDDTGVYFIEDRSDQVSQYRYEPDCTEELLSYLKELCKNPEHLKNLAKV